MQEAISLWRGRDFRRDARIGDSFAGFAGHLPGRDGRRLWLMAAIVSFGQARLPVPVLPHDAANRIQAPCSKILKTHRLS
jgi:hypothetical protein